MRLPRSLLLLFAAACGSPDLDPTVPNEDHALYAARAANHSAPLQDGISGGAAPSARPDDAARCEVTAENAPAATAGNKRWLRIVDASGAPVPGAEYFEGLLPHAAPGGLSVSEALRELWHPDAWLDRHCARQIADGGGCVEPHTTDVPFLYLARNGERQAFWDLWEDEDACRLLPERTCRVTVVDGDGSPVAGAAVVLRCKGDARVNNDPVVGVTGADGACTVTHLQRFAQPRGALGPWCELLPRFGVRGLGVRAADIEFDPKAPPAEVLLTLPPCGIVAVEIRGGDGTPCTSSQRLRLTGADETIEEYASSAGPVDVGLVACGAPLTVCVGRYWCSEPGTGARRYFGPARSGERTVLTLGWADLCAGGCVVIGRALFADRTPARDVVLAVPATHGCMESARTDSDGRFAFLFEGKEVEALQRGSLRIAQREDGAKDVERRAAVCQLPPSRGAGVIDLDTVVLQEARVLVRGRVHATTGPLEQLWIHGDRVGLAVDGDGAFEVRGVACEDTISLTFRAENCAEVSIDAAVGAMDLDVVLQPTGTLRATVQVDAELAQLYTAMRFDLVDERGIRHRSRTREVAGTWQLTWTVPPGSYRLEGKSFASQRAVIDVPRVEVAAGDAGSKPLIFDLRRRLWPMRLSWVDATGEPVGVSFAEVYAADHVFENGDDRYYEATRTDDYGCSLVATEDTVSLIVEGGGFTAAYSGPCADATVVLRRVDRVPFQVRSLPPPPDGGEWTVRAIAASGEGAVLLRKDEEGRFDWRDCGWVFGDVDADGRGQLLLAPRTVYSIELLFHPAETSIRRFTAVDGVPPRIEIGSTLPRELELRFPASDLEAIVR